MPFPYPYGVPPLVEPRKCPIVLGMLKDETLDAASFV